MALVHMSDASYRRAAQEVSHKPRDSQPFRFHPASPAFKHRPSNVSTITPLPNLSISHLLSHPIKPIPETDYDQKLHLSPYTLEQHDSLIPPIHGIAPELLLSIESSSGVPQLTDLTSSTASGQFTQPLRRSLTVSTIQSEGGNSDWEQLQIHVGGRTASMVEISNARLSAANDEVANSLLPGVCAVRMTSNATMCEIEESDEMLEEFGRQDDEEAIDFEAKCEEDLPDMDEEEAVVVNNGTQDIEPRIIKMRSTASTVIIHDYSRQTSAQMEENQGEIPLYENEVEFGRIQSYDPSTPSLPGLPTIPFETHTTTATGIFPPQNTDRSGRNLNRNNNDEFRRQMVERIRSKFSTILDDLDQRIEIQRKILADMS